MRTFLWLLIGAGLALMSWYCYGVIGMGVAAGIWIWYLWRSTDD
jgi:hypothetical protein